MTGGRGNLDSKNQQHPRFNPGWRDRLDVVVRQHDKLNSRFARGLGDLLRGALSIRCGGMNVIRAAELPSRNRLWRRRVLGKRGSEREYRGVSNRRPKQKRSDEPDPTNPALATFARRDPHATRLRVAGEAC